MSCLATVVSMSSSYQSLFGHLVEGFSLATEEMESGFPQGTRSTESWVRENKGTEYIVGRPLKGKELMEEGPGLCEAGEVYLQLSFSTFLASPK